MANLQKVVCPSCTIVIELAMLGSHKCNRNDYLSIYSEISTINNHKSIENRKLSRSSSFFKPGLLTPTVDADFANSYHPKLEVSTPVSLSQSPTSHCQAILGKSSTKSNAINIATPTSPEFHSAHEFLSKKNLETALLDDELGKKSTENHLSDQTNTPKNSQASDVDILMQRLNRIAPGPFDMNGQRQLLRLERMNHLNATLSNLTNITLEVSEKAAYERKNNEAIPAPDHFHSTSCSAINTPSSYAVPPHIHRKENYDGFGPPIYRQDFSRDLTSNNALSPRVSDTSSPQNGMETTKSASLATSTVPTYNLSFSRRLGDEVKVKRSFSDSSSLISSLERTRRLNIRHNSGQKTPTPEYNPRESRRSYQKSSGTNRIDHLMTELEVSLGELQQDVNPVISDSMPIKTPFPPTTPNKANDQKNENSPPIIELKNTPPTINRPRISKGKCKKCGDDIYGKSITSADGRLSGRYHKDCFVCQVCHEPFQTATFYILEDAPYCETHYHERNHSLCGTCNRGIEGQYLATEDGQIHHPTCLKCAQCRQVLPHNYFEMNGQVLCERDALRLFKQKQIHNKNMVNDNFRLERRTTRLLMI